MSSTEYHVNRKELQFVVMEVLEAGKLCGFEDFSEFDEDLFSMTINEVETGKAVRSKTDRSKPLKDFPKHGERWEKEGGWR